MIEKFRKLTLLEKEICETQAKLFLYAIDLHYDIESFAKAYLCSDFCKREIDADYSWLQVNSPKQIMHFILDECGDEIKSCIKEQDREIAYWAGWMYRYICIYTDKQLSSKELYELYPYKNMAESWLGMHTLSFKMASDMMLEAKGLKRAPYEYLYEQER